MEEKYPVLKDAEPFYFEGNEIGVLVQHGFTGTTQSMRFIGESLAKAGFTVYGPRLKGHGTHYEDLENSTYQEWIASAEEGYLKLKEKCEQVYIVGLSMGGTITLHLAHKFPETKGIVLINAAITSSRLKDLKDKEEPRYLDKIGSDIKAPNVEELAYEKTPLKAVQQLLSFLEETEQKLTAISVPALILVSEEDHVVAPENSKLIYSQLNATDKELFTLHDSYHVATLDHDKELIASKATEFIKRLSES